MIRMVHAEWNGREWHCAFFVREGVYHQDHYPVTVGYLGHTEDSNVRERFAQVVTALVRAHLRKGSLPPGGLLINWRREYEHWNSPVPPAELDSQIIAVGLWVSQQILPISQGEGHGYYQPLVPVESRESWAPAFLIAEEAAGAATKQRRSEILLNEKLDRHHESAASA